MVLTREEKRALWLLAGSFLVGAVLYCYHEGGLALGTETSGGNLVKVQVRGAVLNPLAMEVPIGTPLQNVVREALPLETADLSALQLGKPVRESTTVEVKQKGSPGAAHKLNLNTATQEQLEKLPGVGPSMARAIVELRSSRRGFYKLDELKEVNGIGEKKLELLKKYLEVR